ncbi:MAG: SGNH/GDSL hydrolase family protein [Candidatus Zhuqueibacterota bacterium]
MKKIVQNILLLCISSLLILLVLEWISRLSFKQMYPHVTDESGAIVSMQREVGRPEEGLRPNFKGRLQSGEYNTEIRLDSLGFRSPVRKGVGLNGSPVRIVLLGDSYMFGWGVDLEKSFAGYLAEELSQRWRRPVEISNLAIPGTGQFTQLKLLRAIPAINPHLVISGLYVIDYAASGNDLIDNMNDYYSLRKALPSDDLSEKVDWPRKVRRLLKRHSSLYRFIETRLGAILLAKFSGAMNVQRDVAGMNRAWQITDSLLVEINNETALKNARLVLQYIPNMLDFTRRDNQVYERLKRTADANQIAIAPNPIGIIPANDPNFDVGRYYYLVDGHWTSEAHRQCALAMANFIVMMPAPGENIH